VEIIKTMKTSKRLKGIGEYYFSQKLREIDHLNRDGKDIVNLGIGSPDQPPHPDVIKVLQHEASKPNVHGYQSYKGSPVLRKAISNWYRKEYNVVLDPDKEILPLIGSKEGLMHICMTYLGKGDRALVPDPGYPTYSSAVKLAGGKVMTYPLREKNNYEPDLDKFSRKKLKKVKLMFVNYPQMPTGQPPSKDLFDRIVKFARENRILVIHDNPYSFILNDQPLSMLASDSAMDWVIELNSLSKSHNMAGWRIGMLCGAEKKIGEILRFKSNMDSGMFLPLQLAAAHALSLDREWYDSVNQVYRERRDMVYNLLDSLECRYSKQQAGLFIWAAIPDTYKDGYELSDELLYQASVFITPGGIFGKAGEKYIRLSLCSPVDRITEAISRVRTLNEIK
jgi:LL-diaminopimelate aminotransferase